MTYTAIPAQPTLGLNPWYTVETAWKDGVELAISEVDAYAATHIGNAAVHTPSGGSTGQVLMKDSGTTGAYSWHTPAAGVTDHGALTGLTDADHPIAAVIGLQAALDAKSATGHTHSYDATGTAAALVAAHEAAADPHPTYMTSAETAAAYAITARGLPAAGTALQYLRKSSGSDYAVEWATLPVSTPSAPLVLTAASDVIPLALKQFAGGTTNILQTQLSDNTHVLTVTSAGEVRAGPGTNTMSAALRVGGKADGSRRVLSMRAGTDGVTGFPLQNVIELQKSDGTVLGGFDKNFYVFAPNVGRPVQVINASDDPTAQGFIDGTIAMVRPA